MAHVNENFDGSSASTSDNLGRNITALSLPEDNMLESEKRIKLLEAQKDLDPLLGPDTIKLCGILQLPDAAKSFVEILLEYVINSHLINRESTMLQAFQISLCWTATSLLKQKVNHKESLACARKHLNFNCKKDQVDYVYATLQCLKSRLLYCTCSRYPLKDLSNSKVSHSSQKVTAEIGGLSLDHDTAQKDVSKSIKQIQKKFEKKMKKFNHKQCKERSEILRRYKDEAENLEFKHKVESVVIETCMWRNILLRTSKRKMWEVEQQKEVENHKHQMEMHLERLNKLQLEATRNLKVKENIWVEELKKWARDELLYRPCLDAPESAHSTTGGVIVLPQTAEHVTDKAVACSGRIIATAPAYPISSDSELDPMTSVAGLFTDVMSRKNSGKSHDQENFVSVSSGAKGLINIGGTSDSAEVLLDVTENVCSIAALTTPITPSLHSFVECFHNTNPLLFAGLEVSVEVAETVNLVDGPPRPLLVNPTSVEHDPNPEGLHETVSTSHDFCNVVSEIIPSGEEQVHVFSPATMQDKEAETGGHVMLDNDLGTLVAVDLPQMFESTTAMENSEVHKTISSSHDFHNGVPVIPSSSEGQNPVMRVETVQDKVAEAGLLDKESNIYASSGGDQGNLVSMHSSSLEIQIPVSASGKQNSEAQGLAFNSETQVNQQNIIESAVNGNSYEEMPLESSPTEDQDQGTDMVTLSAAQDGDAQGCVNQNTGQPVENPFDDEIEFQPSGEDSDFNQVLQVAMQFNASLPTLSEQTVSEPLTTFSLNQRAHAPTNGFDIPFSHTRPTFVTSHLLLPFNCESLQHELEGLEREREESLKSHEDKKLRLNSDMEKEIEELKAEICQEYQTKLQQIEADFILKKEGLLAIHKNVLIH